MGKITSLKQLAGVGLNTPELVMELPQFMPAAEKLAKWKSWATDQIALKPITSELPRLSIRTERDGEIKTPHYPNYDFKQVASLIKWLAKDGYGIYLFSGIDPKDCKLRGNLHISKSGIGILEYMTGPGTVRDLEKSVPKATAIAYDPETKEKIFPGFKPPIEVDTVMLDYIKKDFFDWILEWSIYHVPVGTLRQHQIYWELRPWR